MSESLKIFVCYARHDQEHKNTLLRHLGGLERRGVIEPWHDGLIDVGSEWQSAIRASIAACDIALLLVSQHFLASEFIQSVELKLLLERNERDGIKVIPIIISPCLWEEEAIGRLQAFPQSGQPLISFREDDGKRDQAWADIVRGLVEIAKTTKVRRGKSRRQLSESECLYMAGSKDPGVRDWSAQYLYDLYLEDKGKATALIQALLEGKEESRQTGLKAAHYIGREAEDLFIWIAERGSRRLRQEAAAALFLIWRAEPNFVYSLMGKLLSVIDGPGDLFYPKKRQAIEFLNDLTITIYINNCHRSDVIHEAANLYQKLSVEKLHLDTLPRWISKQVFGPRFMKFALLPVALSFSRPILETLMFADIQPLDMFFNLPEQDKRCLKRIAKVLDPNADINTVRDDILSMLQSDVLFLNRSAALALSVHLYHNLKKTEPLMCELFSILPPKARLWGLFSFAVLDPRTPPEWLNILEEFMEKLLDDAAVASSGGIMFEKGKFDLLFIPLGLTYGKSSDGRSMPSFERLIARSLADKNFRVVARCVRGLAPIGLYYPEAVFSVLRLAATGLKEPVVSNAFTETLGTIRMLYFDKVDAFVRELQLPEIFQHQVAAAGDIVRVRNYIYKLGHYNNAVHQSLFYPRMRRAFASGELEILATASKPWEFIRLYTTSAFQLAKETNFELLEWIK